MHYSSIVPQLPTKSSKKKIVLKLQFKGLKNWLRFFFKKILHHFLSKQGGGIIKEVVSGNTRCQRNFKKCPRYLHTQKGSHWSKLFFFGFNETVLPVNDGPFLYLTNNNAVWFFSFWIACWTIHNIFACLSFLLFWMAWQN